MKQRHVSGFVSLVGRPNAGKSTLMNALLGTKVAIVADKPQTTRTVIQGVHTDPEAQVILLDTPGILEPKNLLHKRMNERVKEAMQGRDLILFCVDAMRPFQPEDEAALTWIREIDIPVFLVFTKIDLLKRKSDLLPLIDAYRGKHHFAEIIPVSAAKGDGITRLRRAIVAKLPQGPRYFPEDYLTDQPERFLAAELIREQILNLTHREVPHSVAVMIDKWEEAPRKEGGTLTRIMATVHVERPGHKGIIIGRGGEMMKKIGTAARLQMEKLLDRKIFLEVFVKVSEEWRDKAQFLNELEASAVASTASSEPASGEP
jgi:GTPase